jgi:hypothetical protein
MQACCCCDSQNALVGGCAIPALPCKLAAAVITECSGGRRCYTCATMLAVVIHRMLWWKKVCYTCAAMQARCCCDPQNALVQEGCAIPALSCKLCCCCDSRMLWCKEGCAIPALSEARCCCDPQNALVEGVVCYPCAATQLAAVVIHRMPGGRKGVLSRCHAMQAAVMIHRMLWWKSWCAISCAAVQSPHPALEVLSCCHARPDRSGGRSGYACAAMQARCCQDSGVSWWYIPWLHARKLLS